MKSSKNYDQIYTAVYKKRTMEDAEADILFNVREKKVVEKAAHSDALTETLKF